MLFLQDIRFLHNFERRLKSSIEVMPGGVDKAVNNVWLQAPGVSTRKFARWTQLHHGHEGWIQGASLSSTGAVQQAIHIDIFEGSLLIEGHPLGRTAAGGVHEAGFLPSHFWNSHLSNLALWYTGHVLSAFQPF